jgi:tetratricopeptide (TPR) repeat protein
LDLHSKGKRARAFLDQGNFAEAIDLYRQLCRETHTIEPEYDSWLRGLADAFSRVSRPREAAYIFLYLQHFNDAAVLLDQRQSLHRARVLEQQRRHLAAAELYQREGKLVLAAISYEKAGDDERAGSPERAREAFAAARDCWDQLRGSPHLRSFLYEEALVYFNLGACCLKLSDETGSQHLVTAQRLLEEAADAFETAGRRERAFDCYQILLELGRRSGAFENLAEGFINCVRILKEDNLKYYALQYYEDFLREANQRREYHAAASLYREAAEYCRRTGMIYDGYYLKASAETWLRAADKASGDGAAAEMAENCYLAAVECENAVGDYQAVGEAYRRLAQLDLAKKKRERYARIAARYAGAGRGTEVEPFPEYLRQPHAYPEIWYMDLVEWEHRGDPEAVCAAVVGDTRYPDVVRRRALNVMLSLLEGGGLSAEGLAQIAEGLGDLQIYPVLSPLEALFSHDDVRVQRGVMRALRFLFFKRTFAVLARGLESGDALVKQSAVEALGRLHFNHAFDPLVRIFRESQDMDVRSTALESLGRIPSLEAGDFLVEVLRHEQEPLRGTAKRLLSSFDNRDFFPILRQQVEMESEPIRSELIDILRLVGIHVVPGG